MDWFATGYHEELINGIETEAKKRGINTLYFTGRSFNTPIRYEVFHNRLYELVNNEYIDGLLIPNTIVDQFMPEEYHKCLAPFDHIPMVTLSFRYRDFPAILVDNCAGFRHLIEHMLTKHGFTKFAYVHGPENHPDAMVRYSTFREVLASHNIDFDERKIVYGHFINYTGVHAVKTFLDERKLKIKEDIEAIICANDLMAFGVLQELAKRRIFVPKDVAVTGFDNVEAGRNRLIPLTTVRQPLHELGRAGVEAFALHKIPENPLPTLFMPGGTCGCLFLMREYDPGSAFQGGTKESLLQGVCDILYPSGIKEGESTIPAEIINIILKPLTKKRLTKITSEVYNLLILWIKSWGELNHWQEVFIFLENNPPPGGDSGERKFVFQALYKLVADLKQRIEMKKHRKFAQWEEHLRWVNAGLDASAELDDISIHMSNVLPGYLPINNCYIFMYSRPENYSRDFELLNNEKKTGKDKKRKVFKDFHTIVDSFLIPHSPFSFTILPVVFRDVSFGFVIMDYNPELLMVYESIRLSLSVTLKHSFTIIESENRNRKLKELQGKLIQSAHQAGMAQIAINLMHTTGNILNSAYVILDQIIGKLTKTNIQKFRKTNDLLIDNLDNPDLFFNQDPKGKLLPVYYRQLEKMMEQENDEIKEDVLELEKKLSGIVKVIDSLQEISEGIFVSESIDVIECLENSLILKSESIKKEGILVIKDYNNEAEYLVVCYRNKLLHIFTKLLEGAIVRTKKSREKVITISIKYENNKVYLKIANTGMGIKKSNLTKIFNQEYEGPSILNKVNLHFIANSLTEMKASIHAESEGPEDGAAFIIFFSGAET